MDMYGDLIKSPPESGFEVHPNRFRLSAPRDRFQTREAPGTENDTFRERMYKQKLRLPSFCRHIPLFSAIFNHENTTKIPNISNTFDNGVSFGKLQSKLLRCIAES